MSRRSWWLRAWGRAAVGLVLALALTAGSTIVGTVPATATQAGSSGRFDYGPGCAIGPVVPTGTVTQFMIPASPGSPVEVVVDNCTYAIDNSLKNETTGQFIAGTSAGDKVFGRDAPVPPPFVITVDTTLSLYNGGGPASLHLSWHPACQVVTEAGFNAELGQMAALYASEKAEGKSYVGIAPDFDSEFHNAPLNNQRLCFRGHLLRGTELNYWFQGWLAREEGFSEDAAVAIAWLWKALNGASLGPEREWAVREGYRDLRYHTEDTVAPDNAPDSDTSTMEESLGHWAPWFSSDVDRSTTEAHGGSASMKVSVTAPFGWGVTLDNWPGFAISPGPTYISFWARLDAGSGLGATMSVSWHRDDGAVFRTDNVAIPTLTTDWQNVSAGVFAPPGTTSVTVDLSDPSGSPGDSLYVDDIVVAATANLLDEPTATLESSTGRWVPWFSSAVSLAGPPVNGGNFSLEVDVVAPYGWGIQLDDWLAYAATPGPKTIAFWARPGSGANLGATMSVDWRDAAGTLLATDALTIPDISSVGQRASADVVAPPGTALVSVEFSHASGASGDVLYLDDILVAERPA